MSIYIKQYLPYCVGRKATVKGTFMREMSYQIITFQLLHRHEFQNDCTIIPNMRKLSSLTDSEVVFMIEMEHDNFTDVKITRKMSTGGFKYSYRNMDLDQNEISQATFGFGRFSPVQFHYLTTIGIAWWASEDMWESGALIEVND